MWRSSVNSDERGVCVRRQVTCVLTTADDPFECYSNKGHGETCVSQLREQERGVTPLMIDIKNRIPTLVVPFAVIAKKGYENDEWWSR